MREFRSLALLTVGILVFTSVSIGQLNATSAGTRHTSNSFRNSTTTKQNELNIQLETKLTGNGIDKPFVFSGVITNLEDHTVEISSAFLRLEKQEQSEQEKQVLGQNYWAPRVFRLMQEQRSTQPIRLSSNAAHEFNMKLDDLVWGQQQLSGYPQSKFKKIVEYGIYDLRIILSVANSQTSPSSKPITLVYEKRKKKASKAAIACGQCDPRIDPNRPTIYIEMADSSEKP